MLQLRDRYEVKNLETMVGPYSPLRLSQTKKPLEGPDFLVKTKEKSTRGRGVHKYDPNIMTVTASIDLHAS